MKFLNNLSVLTGSLGRSSSREDDILVSLQPDSDKIVAVAARYYEGSGNVLAFHRAPGLVHYLVNAVID